MKTLAEHKTNNLPEFLTTEEAAELLRVSTRTLRRWMERGKVPYIRLGRKFLFRRVQLLVEGRTACTAEEILA
jgi:excisionase family DNA binding protein